MNLPITEDRKETEAWGRRIAAEYPQRYPEEMFLFIKRTYGEFFATDEELQSYIYSAIYCQFIYGSSIQEYGTFGFAEKTHEEKSQYITWYGRYVYMAYLNRACDMHLLDSKYEAYTLLKSFYKRDAMLLSGENDFNTFCAFVKLHSDIFIKPNNLALAEGVHGVTVDADSDLKAVFHSLLAEAAGLSSVKVRRTADKRLIIEERIVPSEFIKALNPAEMSLLRVTTVTIKGQVHFFYPCLRILYGNGIDKCGEEYSCDALIDAETGVVLTDGMNFFACHPVIGGVHIKGLVMPEWDDLKAMLTESALLFPTLRYIGWDVVHTPRGWCIVEGNTNGEFFSQMCVGHGVRDEFEKLIGFRVPPDAMRQFYHIL